MSLSKGANIDEIRSKLIKNSSTLCVLCNQINVPRKTYNAREEKHQLIDTLFRKFNSNFVRLEPPFVHSVYPKLQTLTPFSAVVVQENTIINVKNDCSLIEKCCA